MLSIYIFSYLQDGAIKRIPKSQIHTPTSAPTQTPTPNPAPAPKPALTAVSACITHFRTVHTFFKISINNADK